MEEEKRRKEKRKGGFPKGWTPLAGYAVGCRYRCI
jgi:hypothetical protein